MSARVLSLILRHVRREAGAWDRADVTDADLLERFARHREAAAFAVVLARHGPLVLGGCRYVLGEAGKRIDRYALRTVCCGGMAR
jgi:hypothetical protein